MDFEAGLLYFDSKLVFDRATGGIAADGDGVLTFKGANRTASMSYGLATEFDQVTTSAVAGRAVEPGSVGHADRYRCRFGGEH